VDAATARTAAIGTAVATASAAPARRTLRGLDWLNFFIADVQTGVGPFLAIYLAGNGWDEQRVGIALTTSSLAGIFAQTPAGALIDRLHAKRALIAAGVVAVAIGAILIACFPNFWPVLAGQMLIGGFASIFIPAICAISLGIVGREAFDRRQGRNQTFNSAGNVVAAVSMGVIGYFIADRGVLWFVVALAIPTLITLRAISAADIDYETARGGNEQPTASARLGDLVEAPALVVFLVCAVLFHFANAAMLPLLGEMLAKGHGRGSMAFMSACVVTTQRIVTLVSSRTGTLAAQWGRKPLLLIAFAVLPIRGVLYTLTDRVPLLVAIQVLDGIAAGIFGVVSVLVIADLTRGTGRFNLILGAVSAAVGIGAALSQTIAGSIVHAFGYHAGFLFLAAVAMLALTILAVWMPETLYRPTDGLPPPTPVPWLSALR